MKLGMMVYFDLLSHFGNFGACTDHLVAAKCSIFDEILLQIAISQKLLEGFGYNFTCSIPLDSRIPLPKNKLLLPPEGLLQLAANLIFLQQAVFSAAERMDLQ